MATKQYATFRVGENFFALDILLIREINRNLEIRPVNLAPKFIRGLLNLRGQIVTVMDLGHRIKGEAIELSPTSRCIILKDAEECSEVMSDEQIKELHGEDQNAFLVDEIGDMISVDTDNLEDPPASLGGMRSEYIQNVHRQDGKIFLVLNAYHLLKMDEEKADV